MWGVLFYAMSGSEYLHSGSRHERRTDGSSLVSAKLRGGDDEGVDMGENLQRENVGLLGFGHTGSMPAAVNRVQRRRSGDQGILSGATVGGGGIVSNEAKCST